MNMKTDTIKHDVERFEQWKRQFKWSDCFQVESVIPLDQLGRWPTGTWFQKRQAKVAVERLRRVDE